MKKILITIDDDYTTILNDKKSYNYNKICYNYDKVLRYQKENKNNIVKYENLIRKKKFEKIPKLRDEIELLASYCEMFFIIEQIQKIEDVD